MVHSPIPNRANTTISKQNKHVVQKKWRSEQSENSETKSPKTGDRLRRTNPTSAMPPRQERVRPNHPKRPQDIWTTTWSALTDQPNPLARPLLRAAAAASAALISLLLFPSFLHCYSKPNNENYKARSYLHAWHAAAPPAARRRLGGGRAGCSDIDDAHGALLLAGGARAYCRVRRGAGFDRGRVRPGRLRALPLSRLRPPHLRAPRLAISSEQFGIFYLLIH